MFPLLSPICDAHNPEILEPDLSQIDEESAEPCSFGDGGVTRNRFPLPMDIIDLTYDTLGNFQDIISFQEATSVSPSTGT